MNEMKKVLFFVVMCMSTMSFAIPHDSLDSANVEKTKQEVPKPYIAPDEVHLYAGFKTHHTKHSGKYNEDNEVVLAGYNDWLVGTYDNSYSKRSFVFAYRLYDGKLSLGKRFFVGYDTYLGAATGYTGTDATTVATLVPALVQTVSLGYNITPRSDIRYQLNIIPCNSLLVLNQGIQFTHKLNW
jgi:hypothetical protein